MTKFGLAMGVIFLLPLVLFAGKNLADYPLQIQVVESHWHRLRNGTVDGWGRGDIRDGDAIHGFDFTYSYAEPFQRTIGDAHYLAKWKKEPFKLEMLVGVIGAPDKHYTYELKTSLREDVYVPSPGGAVAVSQEEYKARHAK